MCTYCTEWSRDHSACNINIHLLQHAATTFGSAHHDHRRSSTNSRQRDATHCNTLQHAATTQDLHITIIGVTPPMEGSQMQHTATHCNTLQHAATTQDLHITIIGVTPPMKGDEIGHTSQSLRRPAVHLIRRADVTLQCVAVCCIVLQCVTFHLIRRVDVTLLQCAAVCCSVLQRVAACRSVMQCVAVYCSILQYVVVCFSVVGPLYANLLLT